MLTFTPNLESPINLHVFGLWEEAGVPGRNPRIHTENMQEPQPGTQDLLAVRQQY